jgi:thiamine-monophosphate kinase
MTCILSGGDDYELVFTAPPSARDSVMQVASQSGTAVTRIGCITSDSLVNVLDAHGQPITHGLRSFDHFA